MQRTLLKVTNTAFWRKVVGKNVHATIPKGNMGYGQYTVSNECSCRTYICCFPLALENICPWPPVPFFQISSKNRVHSKPPTIPFGIVACTFSDNLSRNSCIQPESVLNFSLSCPRKKTEPSSFHLQQVSAKSGWKVNGTRLFGSF